MKKTISALTATVVLSASTTGYVLHKKEQEILDLSLSLEDTHSVLKKKKEDYNVLSKEMNIALEEFDKISEELEQQQKKNSSLAKQLKEKSNELNQLKKQRVAAIPTPANNSHTNMNNSSVIRTFTANASAYTVGEPGVTGKTASGLMVKKGMIAMDRSVPFGTKVRITSDSYPSINGIYTVQDRGGAIKGNKIDIYMDSWTEMNKFGRRDVKLEILSIPS
ncbi:MAG: 3D domain-containing protein [Bacilli bacterium]